MYVHVHRVGELLVSFQDVAFLPPTASFHPHFLQIVVVEVKAFEPPHVLSMWLRLSKGMLLVKYFLSSKASVLCQLNFMEIVGLSQS